MLAGTTHRETPRLEIVQLEPSLAGLTPAQMSALSPGQRGLALFAGLRRGTANVGDLFTTEWITKKLPGYLHARPVFSPPSVCSTTRLRRSLSTSV